MRTYVRDRPRPLPTRYRRAFEHKNLLGAEMLLRETGSVDLLEALGFEACCG